MRFAPTAVLVLLAVTPLCARGQIADDARQKFFSVGGIIGVTPVQLVGGATAVANAGAIADVGIQWQRIALGVGLRPWVTAPTARVGGFGIDGFVFTDLRVSHDAMTTLRFGAGYSFEEFDSGTFPTRQSDWIKGAIGSVGVAREMIATEGGESVVFSGDFLISHSQTDVIGRRAPIFEFGVSYRLRSSP